MKNKFISEFKKAFLSEVKKEANYLLEKDLDKGSAGDYYKGYDEDGVNNGVGYMRTRYEIIQDEEQAYEDAKENIISTLESEDMETIYTMFEENADLRNATINFLRGL